MIEFSTIVYILMLIIVISLVMGSIMNWFFEGDLFEDPFNDEHSNTDEAGKPQLDCYTNLIYIYYNSMTRVHFIKATYQ